MRKKRSLFQFSSRSEGSAIEKKRKFETPISFMPEDIWRNFYSKFLDVYTATALSEVNVSFRKVFHKVAVLKRLLRLIILHDMKMVSKELLVNLQYSDLSPALKNLITRIENFNDVTHIKKINLIFLQVDQILNALQFSNGRHHHLTLLEAMTAKEHITDNTDRHFYYSPYEAAYWAQYAYMNELFLLYAVINDAALLDNTKAQAPIFARVQMQGIEMEQQYSLFLMSISETHDISSLKSTLDCKVTLIKQFTNEDNSFNYFQWGIVNGEWRLTMLDDDDREDLSIDKFIFPAPGSNVNTELTINRTTINPEIHAILSRGHSFKFEITESNRLMAAFDKKYYFRGDDENDEFEIFETPEMDAEWDEIVKAQSRWPTWLAALLCNKSFTCKAILMMNNLNLTVAEKEFYPFLLQGDDGAPKAALLYDGIDVNPYTVPDTALAIGCLAGTYMHLNGVRSFTESRYFLFNSLNASNFNLNSFANSQANINGEMGLLPLAP